jgi:Family of unknown function (DUF5343)
MRVPNAFVDKEHTRVSVYPYTSSRGSLVKAIDQFRKNFPSTIDAATLQKFSIAPANESYVISTLRFLGLIDEDGKKVDSKADIFLRGDTEFQSGFEGVIQDAYADLFKDLGTGVWTATREELATWFRVSDKTSDLIGDRQATTFITLASLAGHGAPMKTSSPASSTKPKPVAQSSATKPATSKAQLKSGGVSMAPPTLAAVETQNAVGLTVRVEVNLPASGTPDVYDAIFASIRKHLIDQ